MSIVENVRDPGQPVLGPGTARVAGLLAAVAVSLGQVGVLAMLSKAIDAAIAAEADRYGSHLFWTHTPGWLVVPVILTIIAPLTIVPGVFGWRERQLAPPTVRWRWVVLGAVLAVCALTDAAMIGFGRTGGYATRQEAVWIDKGSETGRQAWGQATGLRLGCRLLGKAGETRTPRIVFDVVFPGGRVAQLGRVVTTGETGAVAWMDDIGPVAQALAHMPASSINRAALDEACVKALNIQDNLAFGRFMGLMGLTLKLPAEA